MLPLGDLLKLKVQNEVEKFLKLWWDTVVDYLILSVVMVAVVTGVIGLNAPGSACTPVLHCPSSDNALPKIQACAIFENSSVFQRNSRGFATILIKLSNRHLLRYINSRCSDSIFWMVRIFPHVLIVMAGSCLVCSNAWFILKSPVLEQFNDLLRQCYRNASTDCAIDNPTSSRDPATMDCVVEIRAFFKATQQHATSVSYINPEQHTRSVARPALNDRNQLKRKLTKFVKGFEREDSRSCKYCSLNFFGITRSYIFIFGIHISGVIAIFGILMWLITKEITTDYECNIDEIIPGLVYDHFACSNSIHKVYSFCAGIFLVLIFFHMLASFIKLGWLLTTDFESINALCRRPPDVPIDLFFY